MACRTIALTRWLLAACLAAVPAIAPAARLSSQEAMVLAAHDAYRVGDSARLDRYAARLHGYLLQPWVQYWALKTRLRKASAKEIGAFLDRNAGTYLADALRRDWLHLLGKNEQWGLFLKQQQLVADDDADIGCYGLLARWHQDHEALNLARFKRYWDAPRRLPRGCMLLAEEAIRAGRLSSEQVWRRFRLLAAANEIASARRTLGLLPRREMPSSRLFSIAAYSPSRFLARLPRLRKRASTELAIMAVLRLAHSNSVLAVRRWEKVLRRFPSADRGYVWGRIATEAAREHVPEATAWFAAAAGSPLSDNQLAWRARIALREGDWAEVRAAIDSMSAAAKGRPAWIYWRARALRALGERTRANAAFRRIADKLGFYGQLAAGELGRRVKLPPRPRAPTAQELALVAARPGVQRALALYRLGLRVQGAREWYWTISGMDDRLLLAAAELARRNRIWDSSINTAERTLLLHDYALRFPTPYAKVLIGQARARELQGNWVLGLVRQESRFVASARSSAGALGLMQLMPATARWIARKEGWRHYSRARVTDVSVNAALGTAYLQHVLEEADGSLVLAAAGYNAGPGRADEWRATHPLEGAIYVESIPFTETRHYVKKVMTNTVLYSEVLGGPRETLKEFLGVVGPRPELP